MTDATQNLFIVERNEERLLQMQQFIKERSENTFVVSGFTNIVQALVKVDQNTGVVILDSDYFGDEYPKIIHFIKNSNSKTIVIPEFDAKKITVVVDSFRKKQHRILLKESVVVKVFTPSKLRQAIEPLRALEHRYGTKKHYQYLVLILLIAGVLFYIST